MTAAAAAAAGSAGLRRCNCCCRCIFLAAVMYSSMLFSNEPAHPNLIVWRGKNSAAFSSEFHVVSRFDRAVLSWNCSGECEFELEVNGKRHVMGNSGAKPAGRKTDFVDVDTLMLKEPATAFRFHAKPAGAGEVILVAVTYWLSSQKCPFDNQPSPAWGKTLDVPQRSQTVEKKNPGSICSPTSVSMALDFFGFKKTTRDVADGVFDQSQKIYGNWPLNTSYAHQVSGLESFVVSANSICELEAEIEAGRPAVASVKFKKDEISNAPIAQTDGHLLVVVGFTKDGDVVVNDPAGKPGAIRRVYKRREFHKAWLENTSGIMYVIKNK